MRYVPIADVRDPRVEDFRLDAPDRLRARGLFVAEGRLVVRRLLADPRHRIRSLLLTPTALHALEAIDALGVHGALPVYVAERRCLSAIAGFDIHRGCLALVERPEPLTVDRTVTLLPQDSTLIVLEQVGNPDNLGGIFRNASAFGADGVILSPGCGDPLYRKAIRVSMGAVLYVPFAIDSQWPSSLAALRDAGFTVIGLTPSPGAVDLDDFLRHAGTTPARAALLFGSEGDGLSPAALAGADHLVRIAMTPGTDSLNLATATGIALHRLRRPPGVHGTSLP